MDVGSGEGVLLKQLGEGGAAGHRLDEDNDLVELEGVQDVVGFSGPPRSLRRTA